MYVDEEVVEVIVVIPGTVVTSVVLKLNVKVAERVEVVVQLASMLASAGWGVATATDRKVLRARRTWCLILDEHFYWSRAGRQSFRIFWIQTGMSGKKS